MNQRLGFLIIVFTLCSHLASGQGIFELSSRYKWEPKTHIDELPPSVFLTLLPHVTKHFAFGLEVHYDMDIQQRNWPDVGSYKIIEKTSGIGLQLRYRTRVTGFLNIRACVGIGANNTTRALKTDESLIKLYVTPPLDQGKALYGYTSLGVEWKVNDQWSVTADRSWGYQWVSLGCMYTLNGGKDE